MRLSVSDIKDYFWCPRSLWLRANGIRRPNVNYCVGRQFHALIHGVTNTIFSIYKQQLPGRIVDMEVTLSTDELIGRIDILRLIEQDGERIYIIQDEKFKDPPKIGRVYPEDKVQIDAYAYLAEQNGYKPVSGLILYNDLIPREVKPAPERIPEIIKIVKSVLSSQNLPPIELSERDKFRNLNDPREKCQYCSYCPLCQILPPRGGITMKEILSLRFLKGTQALKNQLTKTLKEVLG